MTTTFRNVTRTLNLKVGDKVKTDNWDKLRDGDEPGGALLDGKEHTIEDIIPSDKQNSGFSVKIDGYDMYLDSDWLDKI